MFFQNCSGMRGMKNTIPAGRMKLRDRMVYKVLIETFLLIDNIRAVFAGKYMNQVIYSQSRHIFCCFFGMCTCMRGCHYIVKCQERRAGRRLLFKCVESKPTDFT